MTAQRELVVGLEFESPRRSPAPKKIISEACSSTVAAKVKRAPLAQLDKASAYGNTQIQVSQCLAMGVIPAPARRETKVLSRRFRVRVAGGVNPKPTRCNEE